MKFLSLIALSIFVSSQASAITYSSKNEGKYNEEWTCTYTCCPREGESYESTVRSATSKENCLSQAKNNCKGTVSKVVAGSRITYEFEAKHEISELLDSLHYEIDSRPDDLYMDSADASIYE